jgi:hypothetical protein
MKKAGMLPAFFLDLQQQVDQGLDGLLSFLVMK